jgi:hypothetical protein
VSARSSMLAPPGPAMHAHALRLHHVPVQAQRPRAATALCPYKHTCPRGRSSALCPAGTGGETTATCCHTRLSEENQVQTYMHARIKFHAYSDIKVNTETVSRMKEKDYQRFTLYPGNEGTKHHRQSTGGCVRLAPATSS